MALINKIREHSGVAVGVVAVALLLFIVGGDIFSNASGGGSLFGNDNKVGEIAGTDIDYKQFVDRVEIARQNYEAQSGRSASQQEIQQLREQVWEQFINDIAFKDEFDKLGFAVTPDELKEMIQGSRNLHPFVRQQFSDPQTGQYSRERHMQFINAVASNQLPAEQRAGWDEFKRQLMQYRVREKYEKLLAASSYITQAEAKREYVAQTEKVSANYLFVPFFSVNDSTLKVTDNQLADYLSKHKNEFQGYDSRTFDYIVLPITPSKEDSTAMMTDLRELAKGLAKATDAQAFANSNSDVRYRPLRGAAELPVEVVQKLDAAITGQIIGPFKEGQAYSIYKYEGRETEKDSVRASHILIADKAKADQILAQVKAGGNFAELAKANSSDPGSKDKGGDLGYFGRGMMVAPFEQAAFANDGLVPELVQSQFGYHIIKVTGSKTSNKYKVATVSRVLEAGEGTRNQLYQEAENLRTSLKTADDMKKAAEKDSRLAVLTAERVMPMASGFNTIQDGREVVTWSFTDDAKVGSVSDRIFEVEGNYVIAAIKGMSSKDNPQVSDFKDQLTALVKNQLKAESITKRLGNATGDLQTIAKNYGAGALVETVTDVTLATGLLNTAGMDATALGKLFGLAVGKRSQPFVGDNGVFIADVTSRTKAPEVADYSQYKQMVAQRSAAFGVSQMAAQAIREKANIKDNRYKFF